MNRLFIVVTILLSLTSYGQTVSKSDSLKIVEALELVFKAFENPDFEEFQKISTDTIYCLLCQETTIERKNFFDTYLKTIRNYEIYKQVLKSKELVAVHQEHERNTRWSNITAFFPIWERNEQYTFGFFFKKNNGEFKFAGIETIP